MNRPRHVKVVNGRIYWRVPENLKPLGFANIPLGPFDGEDGPLTLAAYKRAANLNSQGDAERERMATYRESPAEGSIGELIQRYKQSSQFIDLAEKTRAEYGKLLRRINDKIGYVMLNAVALPWLIEVYESIQTNNGRAMANGILRVLRLLFNFARSRGTMTNNPLIGFRLSGLESRSVLWDASYVDMICAAAQKTGRSSIALAVHLALDLGQRPSDILALRWDNYADGVFTIRQHKTGTKIAIPLSEMVRATLESVDRRSDNIVISEETERPYTDTAFRRTFSRIRALAGVPYHIQFRDLRRTAATEIGQAGGTDDQIRAITGHKSRAVVAVYVRPDVEMARAAQNKRAAHRRSGKI